MKTIRLRFDDDVVEHLEGAVAGRISVEALEEWLLDLSPSKRTPLVSQVEHVLYENPTGEAILGRLAVLALGSTPLAVRSCGQILRGEWSAPRLMETTALAPPQVLELA